MEAICVLDGCANIIISETIEGVHVLERAGEYFVKNVVNPRPSQELGGTLFHKFTLDHVLEVGREFRYEVESKCTELSVVLDIEVNSKGSELFFLLSEHG